MSSLKSLTSAYSPPQTGELSLFPLNATSTAGLLKCDGSIVSQSTYSNLFSKIGLLQSGNVNNTWTLRTGFTSGTEQVFSLIYENSLYVLCGQSGLIRTSTDLLTWTTRSSGTTSSIYSLAYNGTIYVAVGDRYLATSTDGATWTVRTQVTNTTWFSITYSPTDDRFVKAGFNGMAYSTDAITWTLRSIGTSFAKGVYYLNNLYLVGGQSGYLASSTDGISWTRRSVGNSSNINSFAYSSEAQLYVLNLANSGFATSTDGTTWTVTLTSFGNNLAYGDGVLVSCGAFGSAALTVKAYTSTNAITWNERNTGITITVGSGAGGNPLLYKSSEKEFVVASYAGQGATGEIYNYDTTTQFSLPTSSQLQIVPNFVDVYISP